MNRKDLGDDKTAKANITEMSIKAYVFTESVLVSRLSSGVQLALQKIDFEKLVGIRNLDSNVKG